MSLDPLGFVAGDANVARYVGNLVSGLTDPNGLTEWWALGPSRAMPPPNFARTPNSDRAIEQYAVEGGWGLTLVAPIASDARDGYEFLTGVDLRTKKKLTWLEWGATGIGLGHPSLAERCSESWVGVQG